MKVDECLLAADGAKLTQRLFGAPVAADVEITSPAPISLGADLRAGGAYEGVPGAPGSASPTAVFDRDLRAAIATGKRGGCTKSEREDQVMLGYHVKLRTKISFLVGAVRVSGQTANMPSAG